MLPGVPKHLKSINICIQKLDAKTVCNKTPDKCRNCSKMVPLGRARGGRRTKGFVSFLARARLGAQNGPKTSPRGSKWPRDLPQEPPRALQRTIFDDSGSSLGSFGHDFQVFSQTVFYPIRVTIFHVVSVLLLGPSKGYMQKLEPNHVCTETCRLSYAQTNNTSIYGHVFPYPRLGHGGGEAEGTWIYIYICEP